jgi:hypothetical protein
MDVLICHLTRMAPPNICTAGLNLATLRHVPATGARDPLCFGDSIAAAARGGRHSSDVSHGADH